MDPHDTLRLAGDHSAADTQHLAAQAGDMRAGATWQRVMEDDELSEEALEFVAAVAALQPLHHVYPAVVAVGDGWRLAGGIPMAAQEGKDPDIGIPKTGGPGDLASTFDAPSALYAALTESLGPFVREAHKKRKPVGARTAGRSGSVDEPTHWGKLSGRHIAHGTVVAVHAASDGGGETQGGTMQTVAGEVAPGRQTAHEWSREELEVRAADLGLGVGVGTVEGDPEGGMESQRLWEAVHTAGDVSVSEGTQQSAKPGRWA